MLDYIRQNAQSYTVKAIFGLIIVVFVFWGVGSSTNDTSTVLANVNEQPIRIQDFQRMLQSRAEAAKQQSPFLTDDILRQMGFARNVFQSMVADMLMEQEADRLGITVSPVELKKEIVSQPYFLNEDKKFDPEVYKSVLAAVRRTPGEYESEVSRSLRLSKLSEYVTLPAAVSEAEAKAVFDFQRERAVLELAAFDWQSEVPNVEISDDELNIFYKANQDRYKVGTQASVEYILFTPKALAAKVDVSDEEIRSFYEANARQYFTSPERVHLRHILFKAAEDADERLVEEARVKAENVIADLGKGKDFAALARSRSEGPTGSQGGDLGWVGRGEMVPAFEEAAFALEAGEVSAPVRTPFGWHVIKAEAREAATVKPLVDVKKEIRDLLAEEKGGELVNDLLDEAQDMILAGESLQQVADTLNVTADKTGLFTREEAPVLLGLEESGVKAVFAAPAGTLIDTPLATTEGFLFARVLEIEPEHIKPFEEAKASVVAAVRREKAMDAAKAHAEALVEQIKADPSITPEGLTLDETQPLSRSSNVPGLGQQPALVEAAFAATPGQWLPDAYPVNTGYVVARLKERLKAEDVSWEDQKDTYVNALTSQRQKEMLDAYRQELFAKAEIQVLRPEILE